MKREKNISTGETILWMVITAATVFVVTSFQYTRMTLGDDGRIGLGSNATIYSGESFKKLDRVYSILQNEYLYDMDYEKLEEGAIRGMLEALEDPYTNYFSESEATDFLSETEGEYEGVGIYISIDLNLKRPIVLMPIKGSPAEEAGILPGDYIIEIEGKDTAGVSIEEIASTIKGPRGTSLNMKFLRYDEANKAETFEKTLIRRNVELNPFEYKVIDDNIAYIAFSSFDERADKQFKNAISEMKKTNDIKGIIVDIRNNTGGLLTTAIEIIDEILPTGVITYTVDKAGNKEYLYSDSKTLDLPVVVIVNGNSASASEIMAGAIKDYEKGDVVGTTTYGKGLVQELKSLRDGTYIKLTISEYFSPNGEKINKKGVEPDYIVEQDDESDEDNQLNKAIEVLKSKFNN